MATAAKKPAKKTPAKKSVSKGGRPTAYRPEHNELVRKYCLLGASDVELAEFLGVSEATINTWKLRHPKFLESIKEGKEQADANVANRLYQRALGYEHAEVHVSNFQGAITLTPITKIYAPDPAAAIFWLKNRQRAKWRDKQDLEHTGADGGAIKVDVTLPGDEGYLRMIGKK